MSEAEAIEDRARYRRYQIGQARGACASHVLAFWKQHPELTSGQVVDLLRDLLEQLGLLPSQDPDRMMTATMPTKSGDPRTGLSQASQPKGTDFSNSHYR